MPGTSPGHHASYQAETLHASGQHQNQHNDQDQAEAAAGSVAPVAAVAPGRQRADQRKNQNHDQDGRKHDCLARKRVRLTTFGAEQGSTAPGAPSTIYSVITWSGMLPESDL